MIFGIVLPGALAVAGVCAIAIAMMRKRGEKLFEKYNSFTQSAINEHFQLRDHPVKAEYRVLHPAKAMKLIKIAVESKTSEELERVNTLDATIFGFMKMFTLLIRPSYSYNLPVFSVDIIFVGKKRVFIVELIDPAAIQDENKDFYYNEMRKHTKDLEKFEASGTNSEWAKAYLADFSIHIKADEGDDDVLFQIYQSYLANYLKMASAAPKLKDEEAALLKKGLENYVSDLIGKGGPAVDVFKKLLGPEKQTEYVRSILFGLE